MRSSQRAIFFAAIAFALTIAVFWPVTGNGFVNWGDEAEIVLNPHIREWSARNLAWMWTAFHMGHYQPLTWMTFGLDFTLWKLNPFGFHLTTLLLHGLCASAAYLLIAQVIHVAAGHTASRSAWLMHAAALCGALSFSLHPLRVEEVAWTVERRGVLSALLCTLCVLAYLRYAIAGTSQRTRRPRTAFYYLALVCFFLALLAKEFALTLPAVLVVLDWYPLRRIRDAKGTEFIEGLRDSVTEKLPFLGLTVVWAFIAVQSSATSNVAKSLAEYGIVERLAQGVHALRFYAEKTSAPIDLSPLYAISEHVNLLEWKYLISLGFVLVIAALVIGSRRRAGWAMAASLVCVIVLSPVLGLVQTGMQFAADRYTYLPGVAIGACIAGGLWQLAERLRPRRRSWVWIATLGLVCAGTLTLLSRMTIAQIRVWRDSVSLWEQAVRVDPECAIARNNLGTALVSVNRLDEATANLRLAVQLRPIYIDGIANLGRALAIKGDFSEAVECLRRAHALAPQDEQIKADLERALAALQRSGS